MGNKRKKKEKKRVQSICIRSKSLTFKIINFTAVLDRQVIIGSHVLDTN